MDVEHVKPKIGSIIRAQRRELSDRAVVQQMLDLLEERSVLVFPKLGLNDEEQLAFTDMLGDRVNFTSAASRGPATIDPDVYTVTLDPEMNDEPEYVLGTFFWHMDGLTSGILPPKASVISARALAPKGGHTEFASTYAAYEALPDEEKQDIADLRVMHSVVAAVREVASVEDLDAMRQKMAQEHPLVWQRQNGRKSLLIGYTADYVLGRTRPEGRALLARLLEWTAQPDFTYQHRWQEGDLVVWDNTGALHRVIPYAADSGRMMHRTSVAGVEAVA